MSDYQTEIFLTPGQTMRQYYKDSLKSILNRPNSFKWRLRTLKNNVLKN
jgi:hypothetical protein